MLFSSQSFWYRDKSRDDDEEDEEMFEPVASFKGVAKSFRLNFAPGIRNLHARFQRAIVEAADELLTLQRSGRSLKYYFTLSCNFYKPTEPNTVTDQPVPLSSGACMLLPSSDLKTQTEINYNSILQAIEVFENKGSGKQYTVISNFHSASRLLFITKKFFSPISPV